MAVYTVLEETQIQALTAPYALGELARVQGVGEGVENTNYFLSFQDPAGERRTGDDYLLTIFEHITAGELEFYLQWLEQLLRAPLPVAPALRDRRGQWVQTVRDKPAALFPKLAGSHPRVIDAAHCQAIGDALGRLHASSLGSNHSPHPGPRSQEWLESLIDQVAPHLERDERALLDAARNRARPLLRRNGLPWGLIHGDLFPDNSLFEGEQLTGLVDFFSGGDGLLCFDLAVCVNAWCSDARGALRQPLYAALLDAYQRRRPLLEAERQAWPSSLVLAALRFWISRRAGALFPAEQSAGTVAPSKEPGEYRAILTRRLENCGQ